jgi:signal transduction histidine kinase
MCPCPTTKPAIVCVDKETTSLEATADALKEAFGASHDVLGFTSPSQAMEAIDALKATGRAIALILCDQSVTVPNVNEFFAFVNKRYAGAMKVLVAEQARRSAVQIDTLNECISKPWDREPFLLNIRNLLMQYELACRLTEHQSALERKTKHLKSLHRVGVGLASSFDIDAILRQIEGAVAQLIGDVPIDIYYAGSRSINARPRWLPTSPPPGHLSADARHQLTRMVDSFFDDNEGSDDVSGVAKLHKLLPQLPGGDERELIPISQNAELLGFIIVNPRQMLDKEDRELISILSLQAATALSNIHLTQERIHFERLSAFGRMIGSLVHDFRSPLTAIRGYIGMLAELDLIEGEREEYSRLSIEECNRLNDMIDELLEFTRGRRSKLELKNVSLRDYFEELRPAIQAQFKDDDIRFEMKLDYEGNLYLDPNRMNRAVLNVASNASQAMNGGGAFLIRTERRSDEVVLEFLDTGSGIPEEIRHRIFEPFFSYGKPQGIGLGMSITRKIVEEHGGKISLTSEVGHGTRIRFVLPLVPTEISHQSSVISHQSADNH